MTAGMTHTLSRLVSGYFFALKVIVALLLGGMVVLVFSNVVLRYVFNSGISVYDELSRWAFVWLTFLGAIVALKERRHLGVDLLVAKLPASGRKACLVASHVLMLYATWLLLQGSWMQTVLNWDMPAAVSGLSTGLFYGVGVIFGVSAGLILLFDLWGLLAGRVSAEALLGTEDPAS